MIIIIKANANDKYLNRIEEMTLNIKVITQKDKKLWQDVAEYAENCSWQTTGRHFACKMKKNEFKDWERVFAALEHGSVVGFCALTKKSDVLKIPYTPLIGFVFVGELYRGNKIAEKLCFTAIQYAKEIGFERVYLYSDLVDLYEKMGFIKIHEIEAPWGKTESIYMHMTTTQITVSQFEDKYTQDVI